MEKEFYNGTGSHLTLGYHRHDFVFGICKPTNDDYISQSRLTVCLFQLTVTAQCI